MIVSHELEDGVFKADDIASLAREVEHYLKSKKIPFESNIVGNKVFITYLNMAGTDISEEENRALALCRDRQFEKALIVIREWLQKNPWDSAAFRLLAQIEMENGHFDKAIAYCWDSLKLNPKNQYSLILMGNLLSRDKGLVDEGLAWFRKAKERFPDSVLAVNNYAGALMQKGNSDPKELETLFRKAIQLDPSYINPYYALTGVLENEGDLEGAFNVAQDGLRNSQNRPENVLPVKEALTGILIRIASELSKQVRPEIVEQKCAELEKLWGVPIRIEEDKHLEFPAKMELAEKYGRKYHKLMHNPIHTQNVNVYYLMHELEKQLMRIRSMNEGKDAVLAHDGTGLQSFIEETQPYITDKFRAIVPSDDMGQMLERLMKGVGGQLMNCPLDLLVTARLYESHKELRPCQVIALLKLAQGNIASVMIGVKQDFPKNIVHLNRLMNTISALQLIDLIGIDLLEKLTPSTEELALAKELYAVSKRTNDGFKPGDEWHLVRTFLEKTQCARYFKIVTEVSKRADDKRRDESNRAFGERFSSGDNPALNLAILSYMVAAIKRLRGYDSERVKKIAVEIAILGMKGISPDKHSGYSVPSLDNEDMSGCKMLAYYYVSWRMA
ncbi:MAG: hypothetical protein J6334_02395, partial [Kiritimatiellae bacterium]|nr:hypothetical protein [Kiritimatiellia bacterium]